MLDLTRFLIKRFERRRSLKIPEITQSELGIKGVTVETLENEHRDGNVSLRELRIIAQLIVKRKPKELFEIGTFDGRTTINIARHAPEDAKVYTLDLPKEKIGHTKFNLYKSGFSSDMKYADKERSGTRYENKKESTKITQLYGDSATFNYDPYLGKIDFIFIDGSHARDYVQNDTEVAFRLLGGRGTIVWHDYGVWEDVSDVLDDYFQNDARFKNAKHIKGTSFALLTI